MGNIIEADFQGDIDPKAARASTTVARPVTEIRYQSLNCTRASAMQNHQRRIKMLAKAPERLMIMTNGLLTYSTKQ